VHPAPRRDPGQPCRPAQVLIAEAGADVNAQDDIRDSFLLAGAEGYLKYCGSR
jgi:hypothetical protein